MIVTENLKEDSRVVFITSEKAITKIMANQKKTKEKIFLLFTSQWGDTSQRLLDTIEDSYTRKSRIYVINSFDCPKSFTSYGSLLFCKITSEPSMLRVSGNGNVKQISYLPDVYSALGL